MQSEIPHYLQQLSMIGNKKFTTNHVVDKGHIILDWNNSIQVRLHKITAILKGQKRRKVYDKILPKNDTIFNMMHVKMRKSYNYFSKEISSVSLHY